MPPRALDHEVLQAYLRHLLAGRREACRDTVLGLLDAGVPLRQVYQGLFQASLYEVGRRWETGEVTVVAEHLATALTEELLGLVFPRALGRPPTGRRAVVSCAADDLHQVGGRIVADTLEVLGWTTRFIGAGEPAQRLVEAVVKDRPDLVCLSVAIHLHLPAVEQAVEAIRAVAPALPVVVGGQAFIHGGRERLERFPGVHVLGSLDELEAMVGRWGQAR